MAKTFPTLAKKKEEETAAKLQTEQISKGKTQRYSLPNRNQTNI